MKVKKKKNTTIRTAYQAVLNIEVLVMIQNNKGWATRLTECTCIDGSRRGGRPFTRWRDEITTLRAKNGLGKRKTRADEDQWDSPSPCSRLILDVGYNDDE